MRPGPLDLVAGVRPWRTSEIVYSKIFIFKGFEGARSFAKRGGRRRRSSAQRHAEHQDGHLRSRREGARIRSQGARGLPGGRDGRRGTRERWARRKTERRGQGRRDGAAHSTPRQPTTTAWLYRARSMSSPSEIYELTVRDL